jgi:hypothetical protein
LALAAALTIAVGGLASRARADTAAYDLMIQRSPVEAGDVTPNTGAHRISANSTVTLTANAQPGYHFAYWLGDVSDPAAERTTIVVNEPKIVIAVFQPETQKRIEEQIRAGGGGGGDMLAISTTDLSSPGWSPTGGTVKGETTIIATIVPVVIPEPATIALLTLGTIALRRRRPCGPGPPREMPTSQEASRAKNISTAPAQVLSLYGLSPTAAPVHVHCGMQPPSKCAVR